MRYAAGTDKGLVRELNEDCFECVCEVPGIPATFIIADGMGGHNGGEVASREAVDFVTRQIRQTPGLFSNADQFPEILEKLMLEANRTVYGKAAGNPDYFGMGTTLIIMILHEGKGYIAHVGDSRVYHISAQGIQRLTVDHSYIEELVRNGSLTREEAENHPKRNVITRALGCMEELQPDIYACEFQEGDCLVLCTDGLSNMLEDEEIQEIVESREPKDACSVLIASANERGGEDNITVIVVKNVNG